MSTNFDDSTVVVVGAGPVGLLLALDLHRAGVSVVVIDSRNGLSRPGTRATTLNSRAMHILSTRGLLEQIGDFPQLLRSHFAGLSFDHDESVPFAGDWKLPQSELEATITDVADSEGLEIRWNSSLTDAVQTESGVQLSVRSRGVDGQMFADFLVGCDGQDSTVRSLAGFNLCGNPGRRWLIRADVSDVDLVDRRFKVVEGGMVTSTLLPNGVTRVMVHSHAFQAPSGPVTKADLVRVWDELTGEDLSAGNVLWVDAFADTVQWADRLRSGRILLAGDAAHVLMPAGGMAMNLGIEDAVELSWRLAGVIKGFCAQSALDDYERVAFDNAQRVAANVSAQAHLLLSEHDLEPQRALVSDLLELESVRAEVRAVQSGIGLGVKRTDDSDPLVGTSLPDFAVTDSRGSITNVGQFLRRGRPVLVVESVCERPTVAEAYEFGDVVVLEGQLAAWGSSDVSVAQNCKQVEALLVEPTGRVGWTSAGVRSIGRYLSEEVKFTMRKTTSTDERFNVVDPPRGMREVAARRSGRLEGAQALVTGASRGIGEGIAVRLAAEGAVVAVHCAHDTERANEVVKRIQSDGGAAFAITSPFDSPAHLCDMTSTVVREFAKVSERPTVDILVNNAGVMGGTSFEETSEDKFEDLMRVNVMAPFFLTQEVIKSMPDGGRIINISSGLTRVANPDEIAYSMTKGAIEQLTRHLAKGLAHREITVNAVAPGVTDNGSAIFDNPQAVEEMSKLSPFGRVGKPKDIAGAVAFLASDDGDWVTGSVIDASGGTVLG